MPAPYIIGVNTGTSGDGVDVVAMRFTEHALDYLAGYHLPFESNYVALLQAALNHQDLHWDRYAQLEAGLMDHIIQAVHALLRQVNLPMEAVSMLACHGQTLTHMPERGFTHQMFNPFRLAEHFNCLIACDFRRADMSHGGRGAPLIPLFHQYLCHVKQIASTAFLNIGGIANISVISVDGLKGYDVGPGCCLMDEWYRRHWKQAMEDGGAWAAEGQVMASLLERWHRDAIWDLPYQQAMTREYFSSTWLDGLEAYRPEDVQASCAAFTYQCIERALQRHHVTSVYGFGGGTNIKPLWDRMQANFLCLDVEKTFGFPPQWMESALFAWLGWRCHQSHVHQALPALTGGKATKLGWIYAP